MRAQLGIDTPCYVGIDTLREIVCPGMGLARFRKLVSELEKIGFPKKDPLFDGHYLPAVKAWLDARHGLIEQPAALVVDGEENFGGGKKRNSGAYPAKAQERGDAVLERGQRLPGRGILPVQADPFTQRRHARGD